MKKATQAADLQELVKRHGEIESRGSGRSARGISAVGSWCVKFANGAAEKSEIRIDGAARVVEPQRTT